MRNINIYENIIFVLIIAFFSMALHLRSVGSELDFTKEELERIKVLEKKNKDSERKTPKIHESPQRLLNRTDIYRKHEGSNRQLIRL